MRKCSDGRSVTTQISTHTNKAQHKKDSNSVANQNLSRAKHQICMKYNAINSNGCATRDRSAWGMAKSLVTWHSFNSILTMFFYAHICSNNRRLFSRREHSLFSLTLESKFFYCTFTVRLQFSLVVPTNYNILLSNHRPYN